MGYLRLYDYISNIQTPTLTQLLQGVDEKRILKESTSQAQIVSYLVQKYDVSDEFTDTTIFSRTKTYYADDLIYLDYTAWNNTTLYTVGQMVSYTDSKCYICKLNTTSSHEVPTNTTYWTLIGATNDLFYIKYPYPLFNVNTFYTKGDKVYWKGKNYVCQISTPMPNHFSEINDITYNNIPLRNVFPDNAANGKTYWGEGVAYSVSGFVPNALLPSQWVSGTYAQGSQVLYEGLVWLALKNTSVEPSLDITNWQPQTWIAGDNRNPQIIEAMIWMTLYKLSPLISPRNIPELWQKKYDEYLQWLQMCAEGLVTLAFPVLQPNTGARIRFGGNVKQQNGY
jgi:hypothetical protein